MGWVWVAVGVERNCGKRISNWKPLHCVADRASDCGHFVPQCRRDDRAITQSHLKFQIVKGKRSNAPRRTTRNTSSLRRYREEWANRRLAARGVETKCLRGVSPSLLRIKRRPSKLRVNKRNGCAPFCYPDLTVWAKLCRGYAAKRTDLQSWFHYSRHPRASHTSRPFFRFLPQPLRVPRPSQPFAKGGMGLSCGRSRKICGKRISNWKRDPCEGAGRMPALQGKGNFEFETPPLRRREGERLRSLRSSVQEG